MSRIGGAQVEWRGDEFARDVLRAQKAGLNVGGAVLQGLVKERLNREGTPSSDTGARLLARGQSLLRRIGGDALQRALALSASVRNRRAINLAESLSGGLVDPPGGSPRRRRGDLMRRIEKSAATSDEVIVGTSLEYGRIHETGGVIKHPGGTYYLPWLVAKLGKFVPISNEKAATLKGVKRTKPHTIIMPARPYLRPTLAQNENAIATAMIQAMEQSLAASEGSR